MIVSKEISNAPALSMSQRIIGKERGEREGSWFDVSSLMAYLDLHVELDADSAPRAPNSADK